MSLRPESIPVIPEETLRARPRCLSERQSVFENA